MTDPVADARSPDAGHRARTPPPPWRPAAPTVAGPAPHRPRHRRPPRRRPSRQGPDARRSVGDAPGRHRRMVTSGATDVEVSRRSRRCSSCRSTTPPSTGSGTAARRSPSVRVLARAEVEVAASPRSAGRPRPARRGRPPRSAARRRGAPRLTGVGQGGREDDVLGGELTARAPGDAGRRRAAAPPPAHLEDRELELMEARSTRRRGRRPRGRGGRAPVRDRAARTKWSSRSRSSTPRSPELEARARRLRVGSPRRSSRRTSRSGRATQRGRRPARRHVVPGVPPDDPLDRGRQHPQVGPGDRDLLRQLRRHPRPHVISLDRGHGRGRRGAVRRRVAGEPGARGDRRGRARRDRRPARPPRQHQRAHRHRDEQRRRVQGGDRGAAHRRAPTRPACSGSEPTRSW